MENTIRVILAVHTANKSYVLGGAIQEENSPLNGRTVVNIKAQTATLGKVTSGTPNPFSYSVETKLQDDTTIITRSILFHAVVSIDWIDEIIKEEAVVPKNAE